MNSRINKLAVIAALFFMVCELAYVNAKSLLFIVDEFGIVDKVFAVIGALAFSMVTVIIMRRGQQKWLKIVFPMFDALLVFCGFNIKFAANITANPVALSLTIFMAVFTGLITYSLGSLSYSDANKGELLVSDTKIKLLETELGSLLTGSEKLLTKIELLETDNEKLSTELLTSKAEFDKLKSKLKDSSTEMEKYKTGFMAAERSRILKKAEKNRTEEEVEILKLTEK